MNAGPSLGISWLARLLVALDRLLPSLANLGPAHKSDVVTLARRGETQAPVMLALFDPTPDPVAKTLLDLGCGLGGKTAYYAAHGAQRVIGLEIDPSRAQAAHRYIRMRRLDRAACVVIGDAARLPFRHEAFDLVMAIDAWEHLLEPDQALLASLHVTKPQGAIYISFMPYYSPWGAHVWDWVAVPWLQVILPQRWLLAVVREIDRLCNVNAQRAEPVRVDWQNDQDPARTHRLTVARFAKSVRQLDTHVAQVTALPIGFRACRPIAWLIGRLAALPALQELLTGLVLCVLRKAPKQIAGYKEQSSAEGKNVHT